MRKPSVYMANPRGREKGQKCRCRFSILKNRLKKRTPPAPQEVAGLLYYIRKVIVKGDSRLRLVTFAKEKMWSTEDYRLRVPNMA